MNCTREHTLMRKLALLSRLPAPALDAAKRRVFGSPSPGSLAVQPAAR